MNIAMVSATADLLPVTEIAATDQQSVYLVELANALARLGHRVSLCIRRTNNALPDCVQLDSGVVIQQVQCGPADQAMTDDELLTEMSTFATALAKFWKDDPPAVVHSHGWLAGLATLIAAKETDIRVVHSFHNLGIDSAVRKPVVPRQRSRSDKGSLKSVNKNSTNSAVRLRLERAIGHDVDSVVALSTDEDQQLARIGLRGRKVSIVPAGVDAELFRQDGHVADQAERVRIACIGPMIAASGFDIAIGALKRIPEAKLIIVGESPMPDSDHYVEMTRLRELGKRIGVADRVEFRGRVLHSELPEVFRSVDLLVSPNAQEPFSMIALEAMACGVPVVACAVGAFRDTVVDGATGTLVPPGYPDELAVKLRELVSNPFQREGYSVAGVDRVKSRYTWQRIAQDLQTVYSGLIGETDPAPEAEKALPESEIAPTTAAPA